MRAECLVDRCHELSFGKGYCSSHYRRFKAHGDPLAGGPKQRRATDTFEEIEWFLAAGVHPALIATVLDQQPLSLSRLCRRHGHTDWASLFDAA